ncbi:MAG TPA: hypothetical protein VGB83_06090 [Actinomycetota bacterium]
MRRRRLMVSIAAVMLIAPAASATHFDGDGSTGTFNPRFEAGVANSLAGQASAFEITLEQADHEDPVILADLRIPGAWRLDESMAQIKPGQKPDGTAATRCSHVIDGLGNGQNSDAHFVRAEVVGTNETVINAVFTRPTGPPVVFDGEHAFISWNESTQTALMCLLLITEDQRVTNLQLPEGAPFTIEDVTEVTAEYEVERVDDTWQVVADLRDIVKDAILQDLELSITRFANFFAARSRGNWQTPPGPVGLNPVGGGVYDFRATFETCPGEGAPDAGDYGNCISGRQSVTRTVPITITLPEGGTHPISTLLTPVPGSVLTGVDEVAVEWEEDASAEALAGHILTVAQPGELNPAKVYSRRLFAGGDYPCVAGACSTTLEFPLTTAAGETLAADGKYSVSIVTVSADGHRSDGRCDNGTVEGLGNCGAALTHKPGWASAEILLAPASWALSYVDRLGNVLLIDPDDTRVQLVEWNYGYAERRWTVRNPWFAAADDDSGAFAAYVSPAEPTNGWSIEGFYSAHGATATLMRPWAWVDTPNPYAQSPAGCPVGDCAPPQPTKVPSALVFVGVIVPQPEPPPVPPVPSEPPVAIPTEPPA